MHNATTEANRFLGRRHGHGKPGEDARERATCPGGAPGAVDDRDTKQERSLDGPPRRERGALRGTLIFGNRPHPVRPVRLSGATGVVVDAGEGAFLITAHVIEHVRERATEPRFHFMAGPIALDLARVIAEDQRFDVATVNVDAREVGMLEKDGLQVVRSAEWPLPIPAVYDPVVLAGYPGEWCSDLSWHELETGAETMRSFVRSVDEEQFTTHLDPE